VWPNRALAKGSWSKPPAIAGSPISFATEG
jgi:hypothetical protein